MLILIIWLFSANSVIARISGLSSPRKITISDFESMRDIPGRFAIDSFQCDNILGNLSLGGWAFAYTEEDNSNRTVSIILKDNYRCFELPFDSYTPRADVIQAYSLRHNFNNMLGYGGDFSLATLDQGTYDIYFYCYENDTDKGKIDTNLKLVVTKDGCEYSRRLGGGDLEQWTSERVEPILVPTNSKNNLMTIDVAGLERDKIIIKGWSLVEGQDSTNSNIYISLRDENGNVFQYTTKLIKRPDVADAYHDTIYTNSGFATAIPVEDIANGTWTFNILVENSGMIWGSDSKTVLMERNTIQILE